MSDPRTHLDEALTVAGDALAASLGHADDSPTPCDQYDLDALRAHVLGVAGRTAAMGHGRPAMSAPDHARPADGGWSGAFAAAADETRATWAGRSLDDTVVAPWRELTIAEASGIYAAELVVHAWDLARATGATITPSPGLVAAAREALAREVPVEGRRELFDAVKAQLPAEVPWQDPFAEAAGVPAGSSELDRLVAQSGRDPGWVPMATPLRPSS